MGNRQLAFRAMSVWLLIAGVLLLFPTLGNAVFDLRLKNWGVASEWGAMAVAVGAVSWLYSTDPERYGPCAAFLAFGAWLDVLVNVYWWATGEYTATAALFSIVINGLLGTWLWLVRPRATASVRAGTAG